jgi:hypothetical protein
MYSNEDTIRNGGREYRKSNNRNAFDEQWDHLMAQMVSEQLQLDQDFDVTH